MGKSGEKDEKGWGKEWGVGVLWSLGQLSQAISKTEVKVTYFPARGRAGPLKPKRIRLQPALRPREGEAQVNQQRDQGQERAGVAQRTC